MLPYFKTVEEVEKFVKLINGRCKTMLLVETPEAVDKIDEILSVKGIDEVHIGLNDLHLGYKKKFMFELLVDGTVEYLCNKFKEHGINQYGIGGISRLGTGDLPAEKILIEHYRLDSKAAILSRSFYDTKRNLEKDKIKDIFNQGLSEIRNYEKKIEKMTLEEKKENRKEIEKIVDDIIRRK